MITLLKVEVNLVKAGGKSFTAIALGSSKAASLPDSAVKELNVPWQDLNLNPDHFAFLSWHTRISEFDGREDELKALQEWAASEPKISVKFVTGEGGTGKSRLAAEFAETLQTDGWSAGFVTLRGDQKFPVSKKGVLIVIDYPEENRDEVAELLRDLAGLDNTGSRIRVLFLSRDPLGKWMNFISDNHAINLVDTKAVHLGRLAPIPAYRLYQTALEKASEKLNTCPLPLHEEALAAWLEQAPEHSRALFILAAALHSALNPAEELVQYSGAEVIGKLVERELMRLRRLANAELGKDKELVFPRLLALSAIAGGLSPEQIQALPLGFPDGVDVEAVLTRAGLLNNETVPAPTPDLIAAAFTVTVLAESGKKAPELLWAALSLNFEKGLKNIGRLSYDAAFNLGLKDDPSKWLVKAIAGKPERCEYLLNGVSRNDLPFTLKEVGAAVYETLLTDGKPLLDDEKRALLLNNLGKLQNAKNELEKAKKSYRKAQWIIGKLSVKYLPDMAMTLNNLGVLQAKKNEFKEAERAYRKALEIYLKLAEANPEVYLPEVAGTLNNMGLLQSDKNELGKAEKPYREALGIYRKLSEANPEAYLLDMARTLNNLGVLYGKMNAIEGAEKAFLEALEIYQKLARANPEVYLPYVAMTLNNLGLLQSAKNELGKAESSYGEALGIYRMLSEVSPEAYLPGVAMTAVNLSIFYLQSKPDKEASLAYAKEAFQAAAPFVEVLPAAKEYTSTALQVVQAWGEDVEGFIESALKEMNG